MRILFEASTSYDLKERLANADISVPARSEGRTTDDVERWDMAYLLSCLLQAGLLTFPVKLIHRDRPDFLLVMGNKNIGLEHTEAVPQNEARKEFLREKNNGLKTWFISPVSPDEPPKSRQELMREIEENNHGDGWEGSSPEIAWTEAMLHFVRHKLGITRKAGYDRFDENWLLIYNNWSLPALNIRKVSSTFFQGVKDSGA